jgi:hypothetical protein
MPNNASSTRFQSILAPFMDQFLQEKHACGYAYHGPFASCTASTISWCKKD